jgi:type II secretory ATPase GspE/PulE/Tfp pilus assembly ATPase PilB-like protein
VDGIAIESSSQTATLDPSDSLSLLDMSKASPEAAVAQLLRHAVEMGASDVFFTATANHGLVQMRHLGIMRPLTVLGAEQGRRCLAHVKARADMDISERRRPQDGRWILPIEDSARETAVDLRINAIPTLHGEDLAIRIVPHDQQHLVLEQLGMTPSQLEQYRSMIQSPGGLVLITGPTGSGKSATLYSSLIRLNDGTRKINTIEDPIEYAIDGLRQSQVNPAIDLGFSELLRSVLRQNPDVIMVGEIRDEETAKTVVHAANSGTLVFATLHAPAAPAAVQSLRNLGAHPHFLAASLRGVVSQRLVRTLCPSCRTTLDIGDAPYAFEEIKSQLTSGEGRTLYGATGCTKCNLTGYASRTGVFEVMPVTPGLRELIANAKPARELRDKAVAEGMIQFRQAALLKVARGQTTIEEVFRVIPSEHLLLED